MREAFEREQHRTDKPSQRTQSSGQLNKYGAESRSRQPHTVMLDNRRLMAVTGVKDVPAFDENTITLALEDVTLVVRGEGLHLSKLSLESGDVTIDGVIASMQYMGAASKSLRSKLFR